MPTCVVLANWTDQRIRTARETVQWYEGGSEHLASKYGMNVERIYWTIGPYALVAIMEAIY